MEPRACITTRYDVIYINGYLQPFFSKNWHTGYLRDQAPRRVYIAGARISYQAGFVQRVWPSLLLDTKFTIFPPSQTTGPRRCTRPSKGPGTPPLRVPSRIGLPMSRRQGTHKLTFFLEVELLGSKAIIYKDQEFGRSIIEDHGRVNSAFFRVPPLLAQVTSKCLNSRGSGRSRLASSSLGSGARVGSWLHQILFMLHPTTEEWALLRFGSSALGSDRADIVIVRPWAVHFIALPQIIP